METDDLQIDDKPALCDVQFLEDRINEFNFATTGLYDGRLLSIFVRDESDAIIAGLYGWTWGGCCEVRFLWVREDLRGQGYGRRLLQAAERKAIGRGCQQIVLTTHSFQAPGFYQKLGYTVAGAFDNYPKGHSYIFLQKSLKEFSAMDKQHLNELLTRLHTELQRTDSMDEATRTALQALQADIQTALNLPADERLGYQSLIDQLRASIVQFEGRHPTLALAITQAINALVDAGV